MDPNANLSAQRRMAARIVSQMEDHAAPRDVAGNALLLAELVQALDDWIKRGGALPDAWRR